MANETKVFPQLLFDIDVSVRGIIRVFPKKIYLISIGMQHQKIEFICHFQIIVSEVNFQTCFVQKNSLYLMT
jgi:hypothetical protein